MALIYQSAKQLVQGPLMESAAWGKLGTLSHLVRNASVTPNRLVHGVALGVEALMKDRPQALPLILEPAACTTLRRMSANFAVDVETAIDALEQLNTAIHCGAIETNFTTADLVERPPTLFCETPDAMATLWSSTAPFTYSLSANITDTGLLRAIGDFIADQMQTLGTFHHIVSR